jgi:hypothetical protein
MFRKFYVHISTGPVLRDWVFCIWDVCIRLLSIFVLCIRTAPTYHHQHEKTSIVRKSNVWSDIWVYLTRLSSISGRFIATGGQCWEGNLSRSQKKEKGKHKVNFLQHFYSRDPPMDKHVCRPGLPDFPWYVIPKPDKVYQINTTYTKWS